jgi:hypothetical protein
MLACALILSLAQTSPAEELPLERFRARFERLGDPFESLDAAELKALEAELGALFELPPPWSFDVDPPTAAARHLGAPRLDTTADCEFLCAHLVAPRNVRLRFATTLDAHYVSVSSVSFTDADGRTPCSRHLFATRKNFFAIDALPTVLGAVERELSALPLDGFEIAHVELESARPVGASPSVRCSLSARSTTGASFEFRVYAALALPSNAGRPADFKFLGQLERGDSVIGEVVPAPSLQSALARALAARETLRDLPWNVQVHTAPNGDSAWVDFAHRDKPLDDAPPPVHFLAELSLDAREDAPEAHRWSIGGVPLHPDALRRLLHELDRAQVSGEDEIVLVAACSELRRIDAIVRTSRRRAPLALPARAFRLVLDPGGALASFDTVAVTTLTRAERGERLRWDFELADGARLEARVHRPVMCGVGADLRTYGTLDGRALAVVGGAIETRYFR